MARISFNSEDITGRLLEQMATDFRNMINYDVYILSKMCESPIEVSLGAAILASDRLNWPVHGREITICSNKEVQNYRSDLWLMVPQYKWEGYSIDLAIRTPNYRFQWVFIECDGHQFHERTKDQAAHDRRRDRVVQQSGFPILRFTGSEIFQNAADCAQQFFDFIELRHDDWISPADRGE